MPRAARAPRPSRRARLAQQPLEFGAIQTVAADHRAPEQQHRHVQPVAPCELRVTVHIDGFDRRQRAFAPQPFKRGEHLLAQFAVVPPHDGQAHPQGRTAALALPALTWVAMNCTVSGGTSPTAVILCPSTTVEKAELAPKLVTSGAEAGSGAAPAA
jgi:hypothetical protein